MLKKLYYLTDKGQKEVYRASLWLTIFELVTTLSVLPIFCALYEMLMVYTGRKNETSSLVLYLAASILIVVLSFLSYKKMYKVKYLAAGKENCHLRMSVADKLRKLPESYLSKRDLSDLTSTVMDDIGTIERAITNSVAETVAGIASGIILIIALLFINVKLALCLLSCLPLAVITMSLSNAVSGKTNAKNRILKLDVSESVQEFLENIKSLRASDTMHEYQKKMDYRINRIVPRLLLFEFLAGMCVSVSYNVMRLGIGFVVICGAKMLSKGEITPFVFLLFLLMSVRVYEPLSQALETVGALIASTVAAGRIKEIMEYPEMSGSKDTDIKAFDVEFKNVRFSYDDEEVLKDVSFVAKQGEYTALVGPSGSGKSTIAKLAARFWDIDSGRITVGGTDVSTVEPEELFKYFSIVFQDVTLFHDTIYNNILVGNKNATRQQVMKAAEDAQCMSFIDKIPGGFDAVIGENGHTLSGGERQRLSIARAFLKDAPIVLLDESTASLDPETETSIQIALERLTRNKTVIMIAHRLRTIEKCDKIVVLDEGKIVGCGGHSDLMANCETYKKMQQYQRETDIIKETMSEKKMIS
ncbi:ATP-binding cassette, subfamily B [Butyrivibrio fibrisolvens DSM 3071]|uniref:ATP-binding cassette, subfamily B n=1 Tax=Butyrivibrio fibrisolvens DSM 3071 TaxID=1121131 RepID=A0A1M5YGR1_BUTFI|nr:ABC transporter ATP-binding protein [Butyrivibrio fibrisolvens]SHI10693.1 ATP-binding cassette, subfamily B [Butyrivibrio fibrisolvens DSM 3071]